MSIIKCAVRVCLERVEVTDEILAPLETHGWHLAEGQWVCPECFDEMLANEAHGLPVDLATWEPSYRVCSIYDSPAWQQQEAQP